MSDVGARIVSAAWTRASRLARRMAPAPVRVSGLRVISVGALAAGGAGKTPLAMAIAERLVAAGVPTAIVLRGYAGAASRRGALVSDGSRLLLGADDAGDEAVLAALRVPGALVRVGADRVEAARRARSDGARVVVLDDGFQHVRLHRDVDVVAIDADPRPGDVRREDDRALDRATIVAIRGAAGVPGDPRGVAWTFEPDALVDADGKGCGLPASLAGRRVVLACAVARPERVVETVEALGAKVVARVFARDHAPLAARAARLAGTGDLLVTTEKDLAREPGAWARLGAVALSMRVVLGAGCERLERLLQHP